MDGWMLRLIRRKGDSGETYPGLDGYLSHKNDPSLGPGLGHSVTPRLHNL